MGEVIQLCAVMIGRPFKRCSLDGDGGLINLCTLGRMSIDGSLMFLDLIKSEITMVSDLAQRGK